MWKLRFQDHNSLIRMAPSAKASHATHMVYAKHLFFFWKYKILVHADWDWM